MLDLLQGLRFTMDRKKSRLLDPNQSFYISWFLHKLTDDVIQSPREENPDLTKQIKCQQVLCNPNLSARKVASLIKTLEAARPAIRQPPLPYRSLKGISSQLRDVCAPEQQHLDRTATVVVSEVKDSGWNRYQFLWLRSIHNFRRMQNRLALMLPGTNRKRLLVSAASQTSHKRPRTQSCFFRNESLSQTHMSNTHKRITIRQTDGPLVLMVRLVVSIGQPSVWWLLHLYFLRYFVAQWWKLYNYLFKLRRALSIFELKGNTFCCAPAQKSHILLSHHWFPVWGTTEEIPHWWCVTTLI